MKAEPETARKPEFAALLAQDRAAIGELGLERIAMALVSLFEGISPEEFTRQVRAFMAPRSIRHWHVRCAATSTSRCSSWSTS